LKGKILINGVELLINSKDELISIFGNPEYIEDYGTKGKFYHYKEARWAVNLHIEYLDIFFINSNISFPVFIEEEEFLINRDTSIGTLIYIFNSFSIKWDIPYKKSKMDYLQIEIENGIIIYYYLYNNKIERITKYFV